MLILSFLFFLADNIGTMSPLVLGIGIIVLIILFYLLYKLTSNPGIPATFTGKRLEIGNTGKYITLDTEQYAPGSIKAAPYMDSPDQLWDYVNNNLILESDRGFIDQPTGRLQKVLRWWTNTDENDISTFFSLIWFGGHTSDDWTTDGKFFYHKRSGEIFADGPYHLAWDPLGNKAAGALVAVPASNTTAIPIRVV